MVKKSLVKRASTKKKVARKISRKVVSPKKVSAKIIVADKGLAKNFVDLQKVMVAQSIKIDKLTTQISSLLELFSASAKALAKKEFGLKDEGELKKLNSKLDDLLSKPSVVPANTAPEPMYSPSIDTAAPIPSSAMTQSIIDEPVQQIPSEQPQGFQGVEPQQIPVQPVGNPMSVPVAQTQNSNIQASSNVNLGA